MMPIQSPVTFGMVGERPVFMDERDDSYFMLQGAEEAEFLKLAQEKRRIGPPLRRALGLSDRDPSPERAEAPCCTSSLLDQLPVHAGTGPMDLLRAAHSLRCARRMLKAQSIQDILNSISSVRRAGPSTGPLIAQTLRFLAARMHLPSKANCLADSLALMRFLGPLAAGTTLIFAVKLEPFAGHCLDMRRRL
jgi:hypothetical protein